MTNLCLVTHNVSSTRLVDAHRTDRDLIFKQLMDYNFAYTLFKFLTQRKMLAIDYGLYYNFTLKMRSDSEVIFLV